MRYSLAACALALAALPSVGYAQPAAGPYHVVGTYKVGGDGGWDYVTADSADRRLFIPRGGQSARITVYDLDTMKSIGEIPGFNGHGVAIDPKNGHAFLTSNPVAEFDAKTLKPIKTIAVQGSPDGMLFDGFNDRVYILSHRAPNATVIDANSGDILGTIDLGGAPEETVSDGAGHLYANLEDKGQIAVIDAKTMTVTAHYDLGGKGNGCTGLGFDVKNGILFAACREPSNLVMVSAKDGKVLGTVPIGAGADGAVFNPATMEAFVPAGGAGNLTVVKENSPTSFSVEQTLPTMAGARTLALDSKTGRVFVVSAEYGPPPPADANAPATPGRGPRRGPMVPDSFTILVVGK